MFICLHVHRYVFLSCLYVRKCIRTCSYHVHMSARAYVRRLYSYYVHMSVFVLCSCVCFHEHAARIFFFTRTHAHFFLCTVFMCLLSRTCSSNACACARILDCMRMCPYTFYSVPYMSLLSTICPLYVPNYSNACACVRIHSILSLICLY